VKAAGVAKLGTHATLVNLLLVYPFLPFLQNASSKKTIGEKETNEIGTLGASSKKKSNQAHIIRRRLTSRRPSRDKEQNFQTKSESKRREKMRESRQGK
jgi:hypothetical protein